MKKEYKTPRDFRNALLDKLKQLASVQEKSVQRLQRQVAYDRFLCRLFSGQKAPWILKGGHALELRLQNSRATKDIDLALKDTKLFKAKSLDKQNEIILERLQEKAALNLKDYFEFIVNRPTLDLDAAPYGGGRFPVEAMIDGKIFIKFHIDIGVGDVWIEPHEEIKLSNWLDFANIPTQQIPIISVEQHFAEKIHAYTLPRDGGFNSRVKDLVDIILLIREGRMNKAALEKAINETFARRKTHKIPKELVGPSKEWERPFKAMSDECGVILNLKEAFHELQLFWKDNFKI